MAGWRTIAKNEIRLWTTKFRANRKLFFYILTTIVIFINIFFVLLNRFYFIPFRENDLFEKLFTTFIIIPNIPGILPGQISQLQGIFLNTNIFSSLFIQLLPAIMALICFFIFFMAFTYPIQTSIQELNVSHFEIVLSAPIEPKDMMLGNFLGRVPIYAIADFIVVPIIWAILSMFIPISEFAFLTIAIVILVLFIIGTFLGTITSSYISLKLGQSKGGAERARVYLFLFSIIIAVPIFALSSFPYIFTDPNIQYILKFVPTTWFGDIITYTIIPDYLSTNLLLIFIGLASLFSIGLITISYKYGDRFYSLELGTQEETTRIVKENLGYKTFRWLFGPLFVTQAKEFFRRKENILRIIYSMVISMLVPLSTSMFSSQSYDVLNVLTGDVMPVEIVLLLTGWILAVMIGPMLGSFIMIRSKDMIWIFKKSPRGISGLVYPYLQVNSLMSSLICIPVIVFISIFTVTDLIRLVLFGVGTIVWVFSSLAIAIGVQCWRPAFKEKSPNMSVNIFISFGFFFGILALMFFVMNILGIFSLIIFPLILITISLGILRFGMTRLERLE